MMTEQQEESTPQDDFAPSHWERPPHDYDDERPVIVCDVEGCDWWGTAFASQFSIHSLRRHEQPEGATSNE